MFTNFYCVVRSSPWIWKMDIPQYWYGNVTGLKTYDVVNRSAKFDILSKGGPKKGIMVDLSEGFAHYFRPLVGDLIRPSYLQVGADGADIEVEVYRWTGDEATATKFKPVADVTLSRSYPVRGDAQGLSFWMDDDLLTIKDAYPEITHPTWVHKPNLERRTSKRRVGGLIGGLLDSEDMLWW
jgi:hypothetical protein